MRFYCTLSAFILLIYIQHAIKADEYNDMCRLFQSGTKIRKPGSCTEYIECDGNTGREYACASATLYDRSTQSCVDTNLLADNSCDSNPCDGIDGKWVPDPNNCHGFYYCQNSVAHQGYCMEGYHYESQQCVFSGSSTCTEVAGICDLVPEGTKFADETNCAYYYQCTKGVRKRTACKSTLFDVEANACVENSLASCITYPTPANVCGKATKPTKGFKEDGLTCRGYFYCHDFGTVRDEEPVWGQCPEGTFFNVTGQTCADPLDTACTYNRCQSRGTMLVQSSSNDCHDYIICEDGNEISKKTCKGDMFFDELRQSCVYDIISYRSCDRKK